MQNQLVYWRERYVGSVQLGKSVYQRSNSSESGVDVSVKMTYRQTSNTRRTSVGNKIVDHSDVQISWYPQIIDLCKIDVNGWY